MTGLRGSAAYARQTPWTIAARGIITLYFPFYRYRGGGEHTGVLVTVQLWARILAFLGKTPARKHVP
jgi:hypothetical protein